MYLFTAGCFAITTHLQVPGDIDSEIGRRINDAGHYLIRDGRLRSIKLDGRRLIFVSSVEALLPDAAA